MIGSPNSLLGTCRSPILEIGHHRHQHRDRLDQTRVAGEERLDEEGLVGLPYEIDPGAGDVDPRQIADVVDDLVDLCDHDRSRERSPTTANGRSEPFTSGKLRSP
jgi:uncharacterized protein with von Willebrand factor type A (vWA) domain